MWRLDYRRPGGACSSCLRHRHSRGRGAYQSPALVRWEAAHVPARVKAREPGELGGTAVADVLFGDYNPSGRLAITIPRSAAQLPAYYDCKPSKVFWVEKGSSRNHGYVDMPSSPLYPFGYGLSYTQFQYSNLVVDSPQIRPGANAQVHVEIKNVEKRPGVEAAHYTCMSVLPLCLRPSNNYMDFNEWL